ncbi:MAG: radical SAM protein [Candidatus Omnitrophota bacterium]|nr:radical SAM protein [Candidatus Omnitrophota bacterium]
MSTIMHNLGSVAQLSLTYDCQCNCGHCGIKYLGHSIPNELSLDRIKEIFDDLLLGGFTHVDLSGGEPTLRSDLCEIIALGKQRNFFMSLESNGLLLDSNLVSQLKRAGLDLIYLSLDDYRPALHDKKRGKKGVFVGVLKALLYARRFGLPVHTSLVPKDKEYFTNGDINTHIEFCLRYGAKNVRILFPSYVGNCSKSEKLFCSQEEELSMLECIDLKYKDVVYVESQSCYLSKILEEKKVSCPAKSVFCYISCNGLVMPCPYLPIAFGDIHKESMTEIFSRMHEHPLLRRDGLYCPTRDKEYLATCLKDVSADAPFTFATSQNRIDCRSSCNNECQDCHLPAGEKSTPDLLEEIEKIDPKYQAIHLYGGEIFFRDDILSLLDRASRNFEIVLYTNARIFADDSLVKKLKKFPVKAVKVPFFSLDKMSFDRMTGVKDSYQQTVKGIGNLSGAGIPVSVYLPEDEAKNNLQPLISLGVASISSYAMTDSRPLPDSVLCFGRRVKETRLLWLNHESSVL